MVAMKRSDEIQEVLQTMNLNETVNAMNNHQNSNEERENSRYIAEDMEDRGIIIMSASSTVLPMSLSKRTRTREVASRYKSATISSANAAAITAAHRYISPNRVGGRSPSPIHMGVNEKPRNAINEETEPNLLTHTRPASAERSRRSAWPGTASTTCENKLMSTAHENLVRSSFVKKGVGVREPGLWPSTLSSLSSSMQSDSSNGSSTELQSYITDHDLGNPHGADNGKVVEMVLKGPTQTRFSPQRRRTPLRRKVNASDQRENAKPVIENLASKPDSSIKPDTGDVKISITKGNVDSFMEKDATLSCSASFLPAKYASKGHKTTTTNSPDNDYRNLNDITCVNGDIKEELPAQLDNADELTSRLCETKDETETDHSFPRSNSLVVDNGSDTESTSSGSQSVSSSGANVTIRVRGTVVPARFWQDPTRIKQLKASRSARSTTPIRSSHCTSPSPLSPSYVKTVRVHSPSRRLASPTKNRSGHSMLVSCNATRRVASSSLLNFGLDSHRNKKCISQLEEAHELRLLHNRWLQWHFVNARAHTAMKAQAAEAERQLYQCFSRTCDLRTSIATKQIELNTSRHELKVDSVLEANAAHLDEWESLQSEHSSAVTAVMEALEATIVRVPVIGAKVDIRATKEVLSSAMDIMEEVESSISKVLVRAETTESLLSELAKTIIMEKAALKECGDILALTALLETEEQSLRAHLMQLEDKKMPSSGSFTLLK